MSRWSYFAKRLVMAVPVLIFGTSVTFLVLWAGPLDPIAAKLGQKYNQARACKVGYRLGIYNAQCQPVPVWERYAEFMWDLATFRFGNSWIYESFKVRDLIWNRMPATLWLGFWSVLVALLIGIPLGFYAGMNPNTFGDYTASFGGIVWRAMPNFWLAVILAGAMSAGGPLAFYRGFLVKTNVIGTPSLSFFVGVGEAPYYLLPRMLVEDPVTFGKEFLAAFKQILPAALVLGSSSMGNEMRIGRTAVLETINSDYVETAKAKGLPGRTIIWKHVFRNALIPLVPIITSEFFLLIGGSVLVETVFQINGLGQLFLRAALQADLPVMGALMFIFILITLGFNILQDFLYTIIDPRVGYEQN